MLSRVATSFRATSLRRTFATAAHPFAKVRPTFNGKLYDYVPSLYLATAPMGADVPDKVAADLAAFAEKYHNHPLVLNIQFRIDEMDEDADFMERAQRRPAETTVAEDAQRVTDALMADAHPEAQAMVQTLVIDNQLKILPELTSSFANLIDYQMKRIRVNIGSAKPLSKKHRTTIEKTLTGMLPEGHTAVFTPVVDPDLLGGLLITMDETLLDFSVSSLLTDLSSEMDA